MAELQVARARQASALQALFEARDPGALAALTEVYGDAPAVIEERRRRICALLAAFRERYGDDQVIIVRAPGRVNIMGRHVDHQGGMNNHVAIDRDIYLVVGAADDHTVHMGDLHEARFPSRAHTIDDALAGYTGQPWLDFVNSATVMRRVEQAQGDWSQYVMAPVARLQAEFPDRRLCGLRLMAGGNIPIASGLSSSSAIVVAMMEAMTALNNIELAPERFVELCGEGEWFVGTRGGTGDHAAIKYCRRGTVVQVGFFPFRQVTRVDFPAGYVLLVCNSQVRAAKTEGAKDTFNHRVACYHIGRELLKQEFPHVADRIEHLRDMNTEHLGLDYPALLQMLTRLPLSMTRAEVAARLDDAFCQRIFAGHHESIGPYPVRSVVLYGLAEIARSLRTPEVIGRGDIATFGRWMNLSHDGDRVVTWANGAATPFAVDCSDATLTGALASLTEQVGAYACSVPQIDFMVDTALAVPGVAGVQLAGAGLGGCIMALVRQEAADTLAQTLTEHYYAANGLEPTIYPCFQTGGSGVLPL